MQRFSPALLRRQALRIILWSAAAAPVRLLLRPASAQQKTAKADARYQEHPNGPQHCDACAFYLPPVACRLVRGEVSPNGWCSYFAPKTG